MRDSLLKLGNLNFPIIQETLGMLILEMQVERGIAEINLVTIALVTRSLATGTRFAPSAFLLLRIVIVGIGLLTTH